MPNTEVGRIRSDASGESVELVDSLRCLKRDAVRKEVSIGELADK